MSCGIKWTELTSDVQPHNMEHRITYIQHPGSDSDQDSKSATRDTLAVNELKAAKEHRLTLSITELPAELRWLIQQSQELHIRWSSSNQRQSYGPFASELSPGLHIFYISTKSERTGAEFANAVCPTLKNLFDRSMKCDMPRTTFTTLFVNSTRSARPTPSQFYSYVQSLHDIHSYVKTKVCESDDSICNAAADGLLEAQALDLDYDHTSQAVVISARWDKGPGSGAWNEIIDRSNLKSDTIEIGTFTQEAAPSHEEIKLGGTLTVLGGDSKDSGTLFSFPSRHHALPTAHFTSVLDKPTGLHPTLRLSISIPSSQNPTTYNPTCTLHSYLTLPSPVFLDQYAFRDLLTLASHNLASLLHISGATDLEAPDWAVREWGSAALFQLQPPSLSSGDGNFQVTIPLHSRYMTPTPGGYLNVSIPYPVVFYACEVMDEEAPGLETNPFDRRGLGYDGLFGEGTVFYHVSPRGGSGGVGGGVAGGSSGEDGKGLLKLDLSVPVLDLERAGFVEPVTILTILLGCLWVGWKLWGPLPGVREGGMGVKAGAEGKKER